MRIYLFALLLLVTPMFGVAQEGAVQSQHVWVTGQRTTTPTWLAEPQGDGRYVGVSDPCIDSINGENQALLRAWFLSMLECGTSIKIMHEGYEKSRQISRQDHASYKFAQVARFTPSNEMREFRRGRSFTTLFGEVIVEYFEVGSAADKRRDKREDIDDGQGVKVVSGGGIMGEYVFYGDEVSVLRGKVRSDLVIEARVDGEALSTQYTLSGGRESAQLIRSIGDQSISNKERGRFWYNNIFIFNEDGTRFVDTTTPKYSLLDGLWRGVYDSLTDALVNDPNYEFTVKRVDESYGDEKLSLVRSIFDGHTSLHLDGLSIDENYMQGHWEVVADR